MIFVLSEIWSDCIWKFPSCPSSQWKNVQLFSEEHYILFSNCAGWVIAQHQWKLLGCPTTGNFFLHILSVDFFIPVSEVFFIQEAYWYKVKLSVHQHLSRWQSAFKQGCSVGEQSKVRIWLTVCSFIQSHLGMWTSFSAFPFDWAYRRLDVTCLKSYYSYYYKFLPLSAIEAWPIVIHYCVGCAVTHIDPFYMYSTSRKDVFDSNTFQ